MGNTTVETSAGTAARVAGIAIVIMTVAAIFSTDLSIGRLVVPGDAAMTLDNIMSSLRMFRAGVMGWLVILICDVVAAWGLYQFLKPVNQAISLLMAWFRLVYVGMLGTALLNYIIVLALVGGESSLPAMCAEQVQLNVVLFLTMFQNMWSIGLIVFGFHILLVGYLAYKSTYVPKVFGIVFFLAFVGYVVPNSLMVLAPEYASLVKLLGWIFIIPMLGEVVLGFWLVIKGAHIRLT